MNLSVIIDLLLLSIICVLTINTSGASNDFMNAFNREGSFLYNCRYKLKYKLGRKVLGKQYKPKLKWVDNIKPFTCSLCMSFWCGIIYLLCTGNFTIPYLAITLGIAISTRITAPTINFTIHLVEYCIEKLNELLENGGRKNDR